LVPHGWQGSQKALEMGALGSVLVTPDGYRPPPALGTRHRPGTQRGTLDGAGDDAKGLSSAIPEGPESSHNGMQVTVVRIFRTEFVVFTIVMEGA
jgi:hypothetical protein